MPFRKQRAVNAGRAGLAGCPVRAGRCGALTLDGAFSFHRRARRPRLRRSGSGEWAVWLGPKAGRDQSIHQGPTPAGGEKQVPPRDDIPDFARDIGIGFILAGRMGVEYPYPIASQRHIDLTGFNIDSRQSDIGEHGVEKQGVALPQIPDLEMIARSGKRQYAPFDAKGTDRAGGSAFVLGPDEDGECRGRIHGYDPKRSLRRGGDGQTGSKRRQNRVPVFSHCENPHRPTGP
jgi:hypothetical protein